MLANISLYFGNLSSPCPLHEQPGVELFQNDMEGYSIIATIAIKYNNLIVNFDILNAGLLY